MSSTEGSPSPPDLPENESSAEEESERTLKHSASGDANVEVTVAAPLSSERSASFAPLLTRQWRLWVLAGLIVGPMIPAANIFFYVGTFLAERLLFLPSVGLSLLLGEFLATRISDSRKWKLTRGIFALFLAALVLLGAGKTRHRNLAWRSDHTLFSAALKVCPSSGKVLLNSGILAGQLGRPDWAVELQDRALRAVPGYCDPHYHKGIALAMFGSFDPQ